MEDPNYYLRNENDNLLKQRDNLHYEIGGLKEQIRSLKIVLEKTKKQRDASISLVVALRDAAREQKNYDLSDFLREALREMDVEVQDLRT